MHVVGNAGRLLGPGDDVGGLLPVLERPVGPDVDLADLADRARADDLRTATEPGVGRPLVAHLRADALLPGRLAHQPCFPDRVRQRLLAIDVLAHPHGGHGGRRMVMVGRGDDHGVDLRALLLEQPAIVGVALGVLELLEVLSGPLLIDVADRDDLAEVRHVLGVALPLASHADAGEVQHLVGPDATRPAMPAIGEHPEPRDRGPVQERSTIDGMDS